MTRRQNTKQPESGSTTTLGSGSNLPSMTVALGLEVPEQGRAEIAGDAVDAEAIRPVGGHRDVEHRIVEPGISGEIRPHRRVGGKLDDPLMLVAELQFADRAHHAVRFDAADRRHLEHEAGAGDGRARGSEHAEHSGPRIGRAAHHLHRAVAGIDRQHLQLVRLRVLVRGQHLGHLERRQRLGRVRQLLDLEPDRGQLVGDLGRRRFGVEMLFQPGQR